jgi:predicted amidohydrolase
MVLRSNAVTTGSWVVSVNRPAAGSGGLVGGPSVVVAPDGEVVLETTDPVAVHRLDGSAVDAARVGYPGSLPYFPQVYCAGWSEADG